LYQARPDGIELGDPITSQEETSEAIMLHGESQMEFDKVSDEQIRIILNDRYIIVEAKGYFDQLQEVMKDG